MHRAILVYIVLLAAGCGAQPAQVPAWSPECRAAVDQQAREMQLADQQGGVQLLFLGDSITEAWRGTMCGKPCHPVLRLDCDRFAAVMQRYFGQYKTAIQAVAGDQVEHLKWRLRNGALPTRSQPKVVVLLIGINDMFTLIGSVPGPATVERKAVSVAPAVAGRVQDAVRVLRRRLPRSRIVLLGLLPAGTWGVPPHANHQWPSQYTKALPLVNARLRAFSASQKHVHYVDCGPRFLAANRTAIDAALMPDALHPSAAGMERGVAQCIKPLVDRLMRS